MPIIDKSDGILATAKGLIITFSDKYFKKNLSITENVFNGMNTHVNAVSDHIEMPHFGS